MRKAHRVPADRLRCATHADGLVSRPKRSAGSCVAVVQRKLSFVEPGLDPGEKVFALSHSLIATEPHQPALAGVELADALFGGRDAAVELGEGVRPCLRIAEIDSQRREQVLR